MLDANRENQQNQDDVVENKEENGNEEHPSKQEASPSKLFGSMAGLEASQLFGGDDNLVEEEDTEKEIVKHDVEIEVDSGNMVGYVKVVKNKEATVPVEAADLRAALEEAGVVHGVKESTVEKLAARPIFGIKIEVARGTPAEPGVDGVIDFFVQKDSEYAPEIDSTEEGVIDYKSLAYFQMAKEGQMLCAITPPTEGIPGMDIRGNVLPKQDGKPAHSPRGKNTSFNDDESVLFADCDGVIHFDGTVIEINDCMRIAGDVDVTTGNINFTGDVIIDGDVCEGFTVRAGGNIMVKGVVEGATIIADGDVQIANGINGDGENVRISVGGKLRCKYIEHAFVEAEGDIFAEYIIDSHIDCLGNIELQSGRGVLIGGETKIRGCLTAKDVGNEREKITKVEILGIDMVDAERMAALKQEKEEATTNLKITRDTYKRFYDPVKTGDNEDGQVKAQLANMSRQIEQLQARLEEINADLLHLQTSWKVEYHGSVVCKRKLYQGVKINFGETKFQFFDDSIDHCKVFWADGEVIQGTAGKQ